MTQTLQDRPVIEVFHEIGAIEHHVRLEVSRHLPGDLSYAGFEALMLLARQGDGQSPGELAQALLLGKTATAALLQKMEHSGYITVLTEVNDRRRRRVRMTRSGQTAYLQIKSAMDSKSRALSDGFTDAELRAALPFLKALRTFMTDLNAPLDEPAALSRR